MENKERHLNGPATLPFTDFGWSPPIDFLNQLLADKEQIQDLTYLNTENLAAPVLVVITSHSLH